MTTSREQFLPGYTDEYKKFPDWIIQESLHYRFHYMPKTLAEQEIEDIILIQENAFNNIVTGLHLNPSSEKISYFIYPSITDKEHLMGVSGTAQSVYKDHSIHIVYSHDIKPLGEHEDTHILLLEWGISIGLLQEGVAEYMSGDREWFGKSSTLWLKEAVEQGLNEHISELMSHDAWLNTPDDEAALWYAIAASWTKFLITTFGVERYKELYTVVSRSATAEENIFLFEKIYGESFKNIFDAWQHLLSDSVNK